jgi:hypothetical protein
MKVLLKFAAFALVLLLITQPKPTYATANEFVYDVCEHYFEELEDAKEVLCDFYLRAINDWRIYNLSLVMYLEEEGYKSKAETVEDYGPFGCNTNEISRVEFITYYLDYMKENEERMEDSFTHTIGDALEPYCRKQNRSSEPAFYLEEDEHMRKS